MVLSGFVRCSSDDDFVASRGDCEEVDVGVPAFFAPTRRAGGDILSLLSPGPSVRCRLGNLCLESLEGLLWGCDSVQIARERNQVNTVMQATVMQATVYGLSVGSLLPWEY